MAQEWKHFGAPLRPCSEDVRQMEKIIAEKYSGDAGLRIQLCGVTPEIANMNWSVNSHLLAVEQSAEMIKEVWPGDLDSRRTAVQGDWLDTGSKRNHFDIVIGDGCFISFAYPQGYAALAKTVAEILKQDGLLLMRFFTQLEGKESSDNVFSELLAGNIGSFHAFKWRLAMSLQQSSRQGVCLHDIYRAWLDAAIDEASLMAQTGWSQEAIDTISLYKDKKNHFAFATLSEVHETLAEHFVQESIYFPQYELGDRCPIISLCPR